MDFQAKKLCTLIPYSTLPARQRISEAFVKYCQPTGCQIKVLTDLWLAVFPMYAKKLCRIFFVQNCDNTQNLSVYSISKLRS